MERTRNSSQGQRASKIRIIVFSLSFLFFAYLIIASYYKGNSLSPLKMRGHAAATLSLCKGNEKAGCEVNMSKSEGIRKDPKDVHGNTHNSNRNRHDISKDMAITKPLRKAVGKKSQSTNESLAGKKRISEYHSKGPKLRKKFNCTALFYGDKKELKKANDYLNDRKRDRNATLIPEVDAVKMFSQCDVFKSIRGYVQTAKTEEERHFPLAYVILMHEGFEQMERLVRTLYQPQNVFCIHVDLKSADSLYLAVARFASCFPNIQVASTRYNVTYGHVTRLLADIQCMKDLSKRNQPWRYLLTMVSTEFPLRTNKEKVDIFTNMNGTNEIREAYGIRIESRYTQRHLEVNGKMKKTLLLKSPAPHHITVIKGRANNAFSRQFVDWFQKDKMAQDLLEWSRDTYSPDEHYWGTLNDLYHNPFLKTPGGYTGHPDSKRYLASFTVWLNRKKPESNHCHGLNRHNICIFSSSDLPVLKRRGELCVNKLDLAYDPIAYACMEELIEYRETHPRPINLRRSIKFRS